MATTIAALTSHSRALESQPASQPDSQPSASDESDLQWWRGTIATAGGPLPFEFTIGGDPTEALQIVIYNGAERVRVDRVLRPRGTWSLRFQQYGAQIRAQYVNESGELVDARKGSDFLQGSWDKLKSTGPASSPFHATRTPNRQRYAPSKDLTHANSFRGRWRVRFSQSEDDAVGIFDVSPSGVATGTFLTTTGDYRYLAGRVDGRTLELSCFDGAHAFLFRAHLNDDEQLQGDFWSAPTWHETWIATKDPNVQLEDPWQLSTWKPDVDLTQMSFPTTDAATQLLHDPHASAQLIYLFGTWCPNCRDATIYMKELARRYEARGVRVSGLAFEHTGDLERDSTQVALYARLNEIPFPLLIAGKSNKKEATQAFGALDFVRAYPTFLFVDRTGQVRHVYSGFTGPAAPLEHAALRRGFENRIDGLLAATDTDALRVMSYNIRYAANDAHPWHRRLPVAVAMLEKWRPDLIGMQEVLWKQAVDLESSQFFNKYGRIALGREGGSRGEMMAIYYKKDRLRPLEFDHFWLSETPHIVASKSWGSSLPRMVTWAKFLDLRTQKTFVLANTHFDHRSRQARTKSARLCVEKLTQWKELPCIVTGDFNAVAGRSEPYTILAEHFVDTWNVAKKKGALVSTFHGYRTPNAGGHRIDWILTRGRWKTERAEIVTFEMDGEYPSDHFPVLVDVSLK